jgi:hypothetical protein
MLTPIQNFISISPPHHLCQHAANVINEISKKVYKVTKAVFEVMLSVLTLPIRYIGSKSWSIPGVVLRAPFLAVKRVFIEENTSTFSQELFGMGYHHHSQKELSPDELKPFLKHAAACAYISNCNSSWIEPLGYRALGKQELANKNLQEASPSIEIRKNCLFNPNSGLKIALLIKENELIISFGARGSSKSEMTEKSYSIEMSAVGNLLGAIPEIYEEADRVISWIKQQPEFESKTITLAGQCFGGSLASYCALRHKMKAVSLNPFSLGVGLQANISSETLLNADKYVTNINAKGDLFSDSAYLDTIDYIACYIGLKTPGSFGQRFSIPSAYTSSGDIHNFIFSSFVEHLGFDKRYTPNEILKENPDFLA